MEQWKKKIGLFLTSQGISLFGSSLVQYAIIWYITLQTGSGLMMTIATLCGFIPQVFITLFAGVWADRFNKKKLIMMADGCIAVATFLIALSFLLGYDSIYLLFLVLIVRSFGSGVQTPTVTAFLPDIVPEDKLMRVNGINTTIQSIILILSPALSGALMANLDIQYIFLIDVVTAVIGISIFSFVKYKHKKKEKVKGNYFASIKEGIVYTKNHPLLSRLFIYLSLAYILISPLSFLTPLLVIRSYGADPYFLTFNEMAFFLGNIFGGIAISAWGGFKNRIWTIGLGCFICGIFSILMGLPINFVVYLLFTFGTGLMVSFINTPFITIFQEEVDSEKQGRVFSLISIVSGLVLPLSMIFYGPLSDIIPIQVILMITGALFILGTSILVRDKKIAQFKKESVENGV